VAKTVKARIRRWLDKRGRNQEWLAEQLGISEGMLSQILNRQRQPSLAVAVKLEEITGLRPRDLVGEEVAAR